MEDFRSKINQLILKQYANMESNQKKIQDKYGIEKSPRAQSTWQNIQIVINQVPSTAWDTRDALSDSTLGKKAPEFSKPFKFD